MAVESKCAQLCLAFWSAHNTHTHVHTDSAWKDKQGAVTVQQVTSIRRKARIALLSSFFNRFPWLFLARVAHSPRDFDKPNQRLRGVELLRLGVELEKDREVEPAHVTRHPREPGKLHRAQSAEPAG